MGSKKDFFYPFYYDVRRCHQYSRDAAQNLSRNILIRKLPFKMFGYTKFEEIIFHLSQPRKRTRASTPP